MRKQVGRGKVSRIKALEGKSVRETKDGRKVVVVSTEISVEAYLAHNYNRGGKSLSRHIGEVLERCA